MYNDGKEILLRQRFGFFHHFHLPQIGTFVLEEINSCQVGTQCKVFQFHMSDGTAISVSVDIFIPVVFPPLNSTWVKTP